MRAAVYERLLQAAGPSGTTICVVYQIVNLVAYAIQSLPPPSLAGYVARGWRLLDDLKQV